MTYDNSTKNVTSTLLSTVVFTIQSIRKSCSLSHFLYQDFLQFGKPLGLTPKLIQQVPLSSPLLLLSSGLSLSLLLRTKMRVTMLFIILILYSREVLQQMSILSSSSSSSQKPVFHSRTMTVSLSISFD